MPRTLPNILFGLLVLAVLAASYVAVKKITNKEDDFHFRPQLKITGVTLEDKGKRSFNLYADLQIINDLAIEARVRELGYELLNDGDVVIEERVKKNFTIKKKDTTRLTLPMKVGKSTLVALDKKFAATDSDSAQFRLKAIFKLDVPLRGYRQFEITRDMVLPIFRVLEVESRKISIEKFSLRHPEVDIELKLKNPNSFPITLRDCVLDLQISDDLKLKGDADGKFSLGALESKVITIHAKVLDMQLVEVAWKSLFKDEKTPFKSKLTFKVVSKNDLINNSYFVILKDGMFSELKK